MVWYDTILRTLRAQRAPYAFMMRGSYASSRMQGSFFCDGIELKTLVRAQRAPYACMMQGSFFCDGIVSYSELCARSALPMRV